MLESELIDSIKIDDKVHYFYKCTMADGKIKLGGPEAEANCEDNQYILTWMPIENAKKLETIYPGDVRKMI